MGERGPPAGDDERRAAGHGPADALEPLRAWFRIWEGCVRSRDFAGARRLFSPDVSGFGTFAAIVRGQEALEREQWRKVWPKIRDFRFEVERLHGMIEGDLAWAALPWTSTGFDRGGTPFPRPGRATVVLRRSGDGWLGLHTHFSLVPGTPAHSHGDGGGP